MGEKKKKTQMTGRGRIKGMFREGKLRKGEEEAGGAGASRKRGMTPWKCKGVKKTEKEKRGGLPPDQNS